MSADTATRTSAVIDRIRRMPRKLILFCFALLVTGGAAAAWAASLASTPSKQLSFSWSMPQRIGADADKDGLTDYPTSAAYLNPQSWRVDVDACASKAIADRGGAKVGVTWTVTGNGLAKPVTAAGTCKQALPVPKLGTYTVAAALTADKSVTFTDKAVALKDTLIVSVGDSVASGEGNPDTVGPRQVGIFPFYKAKWEDQQCHRTALAGPAQAAVRLEKRDPHSSVTFLHLACSGAEIDTGLLQPYEGIEPKIDGKVLPKKPAQLDDAVKLVNGRKIDTMLVSIGANNMGFGDIVKSCLLLTDCHTTDQVPGGGKNAAKIYEDGVAKLPKLYAQLDDKLDEMGRAGQLGNVVMTEYYDVSQFDDGATCTGQTPQEKAGNVNPDNAAIDGFTKGEMAWTHDVVTPGINNAVRAAAAKANTSAGPEWNVVEIDDSFAKHGYCAKDRWIRQLFESVAYQHDQNGAFHPNTEGHLLGYGANIETKVAELDGFGGKPVPFDADPRVKLSIDGVSNVLAALDNVDAFETVARAIPFGGREALQAGVQQLFSWIKEGQAKLKELSDRTGMSLTQLENRLDDIDGDGNPLEDVHLSKLAGLHGDLDVDISPKLLTTKYEVRVKLKLSLDKESTLATVADGLKLNGQALANDLGFTFDQTLTIDPMAAKPVTIPADGAQIAKLSIGMNGEYGTDKSKTNPLSLDLGLLQASAKGTVAGNIGVGLKLIDPDGSGVIDATQLSKPGKLFDLRCLSTGAKIKLDVSGSFAGLGAKAGTITLDDTNLCDGISAPDVQLADLGQFRNLTLADLINGLAQVTRAIQTAQSAGDLKIPFIAEPLSALTSVNEKLVKFFVDNGFTDPKNPLANITVDTSEDAKIKTLQALAPALEKALDLPSGALDMTFDDGRVTFALKKSVDPAAKPNAGTLDFGDTMNGNGITGITGRAKASIDPRYDLDLGFGFDLRPGLSFDDRFFLTNGSKGYAFALDADVKADLDLTGTASVASLHLVDSDSAGPVTLLKRKSDATPMLTVALNEPGTADGRITLAELATVTESKLPVTAKINATVPSTTLKADADVLGLSVASGTLTVAWPSVADPKTLTVSADGKFTDYVLPFAFDTKNPRKLVGDVLNATRQAITRLRASVASGASTSQVPLPIVGKSIADLDPVLTKVQTALDKLISANEVTTISVLREKINRLLVDALKVDVTKGVPNLITVKYEAQTAAKKAALVVGLDLGACTDDRHKSDNDGCTVSTPPADAPFNLQLGKSSTVGGIAGVGAKGGVKVSFDIRAHLTIGVTLPRVTASKDPLALPVADGPPVLFVQDDTGFSAGIGVKFNGSLHAALGPVEVDLGAANKPAVAQLATRFTMGAKNPTGARMTIGSDTLNKFLDGLVPASANGTGQTTVHETNKSLAAWCGTNPPADADPRPDACAVMPVFLEGNELGPVTFTAMNLLDPATWDVNADKVLAALKNEVIQFKLLVSGVRTLAKQLEQTLRSLPAGTRVPLLGTEVTSAADVVKVFDEKVLGPVDSLSSTLAKVATVGKAVDETKTALGAIEGVREKPGVDVVTTCRHANGTGPCDLKTDPIAALQSFEIKLPIALQIERDLAKFDIGFPGLKLSSEDKVKGTAGLDLNLAFGLDRDLGFYVPANQSTPEVGLHVGGQLPQTMAGELAFLPIGIEDLTPGVDDVSVTAGVSLKTKRADGRLPLQDLASVELLPTFSAKAAVHLGVKTEQRASGVSSALPVFRTKVLVDADVSWHGTPNIKPVTNASVKFDDVTVDGGSLVTDFLKPTAKELRKITGPLEKPIDEIRKPIPGISDAAKRAGKEQITWYGAFKKVDEILNPPNSKNPSGLQMVDRVIQFVDLVRAIDDDHSTTGEIPLGSFSVDTGAAADPIAVSDAGKLVVGHSSLDEGVFSKLKLGDGQHDDTNLLTDAQNTGGLSFPAFDDPTLLFKMLLGQDVSLVYFDAGRLAIEKSFQLSYPIGPAKLYIGGGAGLRGHFAVGFDTYGLRKAYEVLSDADPSNNGAWDIAKGILQGIYIDDFDKDGNDVPEITLEAELTAGASVGIPGFEVGAEGGIHGQIDFNLHTEPEQNGKVRYTDIAKQFKVNPSPICFFDASAQVDAFIRLYIDTPLGRDDYPIASGTIWKQDDLLTFCKTKQGGGNELADLENGKLTLKTGDDAQSIFVERKDDKTVQVSANGLVESYSPVTEVYADLKLGDDVFDVREPGGLTTPLKVTVCGGGGNDRIGSQAGTALLVGDGGDGCPTINVALAGNDTLTAGEYADALYGGPGNDALDGGAGTDKLFGAAGTDVLRGGLGKDAIDGGEGDDTTDYGDHSQSTAITLPGPSGSQGEADDAKTVENIYGSGSADTITLPATGAYRVDAGSGNDTVTTTGATSLVVAGDDDDTVTTGAGGSTVVGGGGNDTFVDGPGSQIYIGEQGRDTVDYRKATKRVVVTVDGVADDGPDTKLADNVMDADVVIGTGFDDQLNGSSAGEELRGMAGTDRLDGGPGADTLQGGDGDDSLDGGPDGDTLDGGKGDDLMVGGSGADDFTGGPDADTADYSARTEDLTIYKDGKANDGSAQDSWHDNVNAGENEDVEKIVGGSGKDLIEGDARADLLVGNDGNDTLYGNHGVDTLDGGNGNDSLYDYTNGTREQDGEGMKDVYLGGDGNDSVFGSGGEDTYDLGTGDDKADAGNGADTVLGGDGDDQVWAGDGADVISGGAGDDSLSGEGGNDVIHQDTSVKGGVVRGGNDEDTLYNGTDNGGSVYAGYDSSVDDPDTGPNTIYGYTGAKNYYYGAGGADTMVLGDADDFVEGGAGDDVIKAGNGRNDVYGSDGDDTITLGGDTDTLNNVSGGDDDDTITGGAAQDNIAGGDGDDVIDGGDNDDELDGDAGNDTLTGGLQADHFIGADGVDTVSYAERTRPVSVNESGNREEGDPVLDASKDLRHDGDRDSIDPDVEKIVGGSGNDVMTIVSGYRKVPFTLVGGAGDDTMTSKRPLAATFVGGPGKDTLTGGAGNDTFVADPTQDGADDMTGGAGADSADYTARAAGRAVVSFDGVANDGGSGEHDNVRVDVESAPGATIDGTAPRPTVSVSGTKVTEGATGARKTATVTVKLSDEYGSDVTVPWRFTAGTATAGRDFTAATGTLTVPAGKTSATLGLQVIGDALDENDETATVRLGAVTDVNLGTSTVTVVIADDDLPPALTIAGGSVLEGKAGAASRMVFTVRLTAPSGKAVSTRFATANGTAKAGSDYVARVVSVGFAPGQTVKTVVVTVRGDKAKEKNEVFYGVLSKPVNASVRVAKAAGAIRNDDK